MRREFRLGSVWGLLFFAPALVRIAAPQIRPEVETRIVIETSPQAKIFLDNTLRGEAPQNGVFTIQEAKAGTHELRVEASGKRPFARKITVSTGQTATIQAKLADYTGDLEVFTVPQAGIVLNGKPAGNADGSGRLLVRGLRATKYTVRATLTGYFPAEQQITLSPDMVTSLTLEMEHSKAVQQSNASPPAFAKYRRLLGHDDELGEIRGLFFQPGGQLISWANRIIAWDAETGRQIRTIEVDPQRYYVVSLDLRWVTFAYFYSNTNTNRSAFLETNRAHEMWERSRRVELSPQINGTPQDYSPDSKRVAIVDRASSDKNEGTAEIWELETGKKLKTLLDPSIREVAFSPDGRTIVTGRSTVVLWDASSGDRVRELPVKGGGIRRLVFSDDSRWLAVVCDSRIELWESASGRAGSVVDVSGVNGTNFYDAVFTHDGKHLITSRNPDIYIWETASGGQVGETYKQSQGRLALSPDGRRLVVASGHDLIVWRRTN